ncbi:MAG: thiol:disulfide interchange protein, partial [Beggiatoa sp. IS2]
MIRYLFPLILFIVLAVYLYVGLSLNPRDIGSTRIDKPAPAFTLPEISDTNKTMNEKYFLGKVSLFNVWASWCVTCRYEHPLLLQLAQQKLNIY